nr:sulfated surface glycoprotein 185-like [Aedes albopictus]XP_029728093.1 sulfated surface glycoprotein 185-like [Aedes albopictus]
MQNETKSYRTDTTTKKHVRHKFGLCRRENGAKVSVSNPTTSATMQYFHKAWLFLGLTVFLTLTVDRGECQAPMPPNAINRRPPQPPPLPQRLRRIRFTTTLAPTTTTLPPTTTTTEAPTTTTPEPTTTTRGRRRPPTPQRNRPSPPSRPSRPSRGSRPSRPPPPPPPPRPTLNPDRRPLAPWPIFPLPRLVLFPALRRD